MDAPRRGSRQARLGAANGADSGGRLRESERSLLIGLIRHTDTAASEILIPSKLGLAAASSSASAASSSQRGLPGSGPAERAPLLASRVFQ